MPFNLKSQKGAIMVIFTLIFTILIGICALVIDIARVSIEKAKFQNAIDASVLAAAQDLPDISVAADTVNHYIELNGYNSSDITITFSNSNKTISISGSKKVNYTLAKIIGFDSITLSLSAVVESSVSDSFKYALFSGSQTTTLILNGSNQYVEGSSHTNKNFIANGSKITITGDCEAMTTITVNGSQININNKFPNSAFIAMPDFSETIRLQAENAGQIYSGNKTYNGSSMVVDQPIYVNGNVTVNGSKFKGKGCVLATGNITFNGSNLNESSSDTVCFYSKNGNI
jgi:Flp pilus assembly protein TadG